MPTRLSTACLPAVRRSSTPGASTSACTTSTVGKRIRCLARSRRREGTVTLMPCPDSAATRWRPMKPEPPATSTLSSFTDASGKLVVLDQLAAVARRNGAQPCFERRGLLLQNRGIEHRVRHYLPDVVAGLGEWDGLYVDRAFERLGVAPAARARRPGIVRRGGEHRMAELVEHQLHVLGAQVHVGLDLGDVAMAVPTDRKGGV